MPKGNVLPSAGAIYSFRTTPFSEFASPSTGRYSAFKVLIVEPRLIVVAVLDGVWDAPPSTDDAAKRPILHQKRFAHTGRLAIFGVNIEWWTISDLSEVVPLGIVSVSAEEARLAANIVKRAPGSSFSPLDYANFAAEGEWRWKHDRDALVAEQEQVAAKRNVARAAQEERYRTRLKGLTWQQLLGETPFERWSKSPPFPPDEFTRAARNAIHSACNKLMALGAKPRKQDVRNVLRECVLWFNKADERAGNVIETEEREDICAALEEMAHVARQGGLASEIDDWRNW